MLKLEHAELKKLQDAVQSENVQLRQDVNNLKDALTKESGSSASNASNLTQDVADHPSVSLVIGDSMLRDFDANTFENAVIKSTSGATVSDVFKELNGRKDLASFKDIVIHAGTNDITKNIALDDTISAMEASITLIMVKAPTARVFISAVCPRTKGLVHHKVDTLNTALKDLALRLGCNFVDAGSLMVYKNGDVDESQLNSDGLHLSDRGTATLTKAFTGVVPSLVPSDRSWSRVTSNKRSSQDTKQQGHQRKHQRSRDHDGTNRWVSSRHNIRDRPSVSRDSLDSSRGRHQRDYKRRDHPRDHFKQTYHYRSDNFYHHRRDVDHGDRPMAISRGDNNRSGTSSYSGCYNCGLNNHNQSTCFHKERLRCNFCNCLGHKSNYCTERNSRY